MIRITGETVWKVTNWKEKKILEILTSSLDGEESRTVVQSDLTGWSFDSSEQQKNTLLHPLYFSSSHLIYNKDSKDNFSASYRMIAFR